MNVIHCPHCGTTNRAGSNFCNRCGAALRGDEASEAQRPTRPEDESHQLSSASPVPTHVPAEEGVEPPARHGDEPLSLPIPEATLETDGEEAPPEPAASPMSRRFVPGVQGLLEPLRIANEFGEQLDAFATAPVLTATLALEAEQLRRIRTLLTEDPVLLDVTSPVERQPLRRLHLPWLILLLSVLLGVPILLDLFGPVGTPQAWPGVTEAYTLINELPSEATVLMIWAYDPATAAELDLVALPLASHLLERRIQPVIISQLPGGLATAQRLFDRAVQGLLADSTFRFTTDRELYIQAGFLPGGAALLALVAQEPAAALVRHAPAAAATLPLPAGAVARPALTIIVAAQAEDVQQWLEQGQPWQYAPTLAFTSAGADPLLRPYLDSGQLSGLVSGFDGAFTYQGLRTVHLAVAEEALLNRQLIFQNWGHIALLLLIGLGNLAAWGRGGTRG